MVGDYFASTKILPLRRSQFPVFCEAPVTVFQSAMSLDVTFPYDNYMSHMRHIVVIYGRRFQRDLAVTTKRDGDEIGHVL